MNLRDYLHFKKITVRAFAQMTDMAPIYISQIKNGKNIPSAKLARRIEAITNGEVEASQFEEERQKRKKGADEKSAPPKYGSPNADLCVK